MNKYDSEVMWSLLLKAGYEFTEDWQKAQVVLVNTCSVRQHAEDKVYSLLGQWGKYKRQENPDLIIGICGCMAQKEGGKLLKKMPYLDLVCGTYSIPLIHTFIKELQNQRGRRLETSEKLCKFTPPLYEAKGGSITAWVAIMRGCENYCSYCVVPYLRGKERSRGAEDIVREVQELAEKRVKEVTLLGQNVNSYKFKIQDSRFKIDFAGLLEKVNDIEGIERIRFTTSHPKDMSEETMAAVRDLPKVCERIHLPVQSGSDRILKLMNRGYTRAQYKELASQIKEKIPGVSITTDIMVGFPGEKEKDFKDTYNLVQEIPFDASFIFKYSTRPGTKAAEMKDDVPEKEKKQRLNQLLALQKKLSQSINERLIGQEVEVLLERIEEKPTPKLFGKTRNFKSVVIETNSKEPAKLLGQIVKVKIDKVENAILQGKI